MTVFTMGPRADEKRANVGSAFESPWPKLSPAV
jgi:hypothetical protein